MANEIKNQEFNRAIKQLQTLVRDKNIISLAERLHNLKVEMSNLTRAVKDKENSLLMEKTKVEAPKVEETEIIPVEEETRELVWLRGLPSVEDRL